MGFQVFGFCKVCDDGTEKRLVSRAKGLCLHHYKVEQYAKAKLKKGKSIAAVSEGQKEIEKRDSKFYRDVWRSRKHVSEISGEVLPDKMERFFMSHILTKKLYPHYRHNPENILLMTKAEHFNWEFCAPTGEKWVRAKELQERLRNEYNEKERNGEWL
jgi:hypothetical protein